MPHHGTDQDWHISAEADLDGGNAPNGCLVRQLKRLGKIVRGVAA